MGKIKGQAGGDAHVLPGYRARSRARKAPSLPVHQGELAVTLSEEQYRYCFSCFGTGTDWSDLDPCAVPRLVACRECSGNGGWWEAPSVSGSSVSPGQSTGYEYSREGKG